MDHDDDNGDDMRKGENGVDNDDNNSMIEVNTSTVCSKIPIPSTIDTSSTSEGNVNNKISSTTVVGSNERSFKSCNRGKRNGSSSYVRTYDIKIQHLFDLILALETVSQRSFRL